MSNPESNTTNHLLFETAIPRPDYLIKSIAEQGYSFETSIGDLVDNAISAQADYINILIDVQNEPFTLLLSDNGIGMSEEQLIASMKFPSSSIDNIRNATDLGRFGLGMKTASFSQTRKLVVISKEKSSNKYLGRSWDVEYLKQNGEWRILILSDEQIEKYLKTNERLKNDQINSEKSFSPNTIIIWQGLYKFEQYLDHKAEYLKTQISDLTSEYLPLVFHRFLERKKNPVTIKVNNKTIKPFNPFPANETDLRKIQSKQKLFNQDLISLEGYILPLRSIAESKEKNNIWTTEKRGLLDMEGLYIYRSDRLILFGGWNGIIKKSNKLQLARMKIEIGNKVDSLLHLNVAKSTIEIPFDLKAGIFRYIVDLKTDAEKEYLNRALTEVISQQPEGKDNVFHKKVTGNGIKLIINTEFPLISIILNEINEKQSKLFLLLLKIISNQINKYTRAYDEYNESEILSETNKDSENELFEVIKTLLKEGMSTKLIKSAILPNLDIKDQEKRTQINNILDQADDKLSM